MYVRIHVLALNPPQVVVELCKLYIYIYKLYINISYIIYTRIMHNIDAAAQGQRCQFATSDREHTDMFGRFWGWDVFFNGCCPPKGSLRILGEPGLA